MPKYGSALRSSTSAADGGSACTTGDSSASCSRTSR